MKSILAGRDPGVKAAEVLVGDQMKPRPTSGHAQQKAWRVGVATDLVEADRARHPRSNAVTDHRFESKSLGVDVQTRCYPRTNTTISVSRPRARSR